MATVKRVLPYLQKRPSAWYFRYRLPSEIQSIANCSEVRISLGTKNYAIARERVEQAFPFVLALKRLKRMSKELTPEITQQVLDQVFTQLVDRLEQSRAPWNRKTDLLALTGTDNPINQLKANQHALKVSKLSSDIKNCRIGEAKPAARAKLKRIGVDFSESSPEFKGLCLNLLKLGTTFWEAQKHRAADDFAYELTLLDQLRQQGYSEQSTQHRNVSLSSSWQEYFSEKSGGLPSPDWSERTAKGQMVTFEEFIEIVGDQPITSMTRQTIVDYLDTVSRIPKNRSKLFSGLSISDLLALDLEPSALPADRTVSEKLTQVRAFLRWCRVSRDYIQTDPTESVKVKAASRSYSVFTKDDLRLLFENETYRESKHRKSWQYWIPLLALYTGARQNELAQLKASDIQEEDGIWLIVITDFGEGQRVKTQAANRKVPIHTELRRLGFIEYAVTLNEKGYERLFPDLKKGTNSWGQKVSRWFGDTVVVKCSSRDLI